VSSEQLIGQIIDAVHAVYEEGGQYPHVEHSHSRRRLIERFAPALAVRSADDKLRDTLTRMATPGYRILQRDRAIYDDLPPIEFVAGYDFNIDERELAKFWLAVLDRFA